MYLRRESARKPASTFQAYPFYPGILAKLRQAPAAWYLDDKKKGREEERKRGKEHLVQLARRIALVVTTNFYSNLTHEFPR